MSKFQILLTYKECFKLLFQFCRWENIGLEMLSDFLKTTKEAPMWQNWDFKSLFLPLYQSRLLETFSEKFMKFLLNLFYFNPLNIGNAYKIILYLKIFY